MKKQVSVLIANTLNDIPKNDTQNVYCQMVRSVNRCNVCVDTSVLHKTR